MVLILLSVAPSHRKYDLRWGWWVSGGQLGVGKGGRVSVAESVLVY